MRVRILAGPGGGIQVVGETAQESDYLEWLGQNSPSAETGRCNETVVLTLRGSPAHDAEEQVLSNRGGPVSGVLPVKSISEPEVPEEIKNLLWSDWHKRQCPEAFTPQSGVDLFESHNAQVTEAYRRGQKAGK